MLALPPAAGVGFKAMHLADALADPHPPAFVEVHAENYFGAGGPPHRQLDAIAATRPVSIHGVGLSLGGDARPEPTHLQALRRLLDRHPPAAFSEHLAWSSHEGNYLADLLPVPLTREQLERSVAHVDEVQQSLGRRLLVENPSSYLRFRARDFDEAGFLAALVARTGCGLLLDVNNLYVTARNCGVDVDAYLATLPLEAVGELHLAGHTADAATGLLIDDHGAPVAEAVWLLYERVLRATGPRPTLVEWDTAPPSWADLCREAVLAQALIDRHA